MGHTHRCQLAFKKKKKNQVKSPSPESRVPETGSDPPIGSDRDPGRDNTNLIDPLPIDRESVGNSTVTSQLSSLD